jgi:NAD(P)H-hydrate epimerase
MRRIVLEKDEILRIERETEEKFGISPLILMENAGRESFYVLKREIKNIKNKKFIIFCGKGNNGGDGFVIGRYLFNFGASVNIYYFGKPEEFTEISKKNFQILNKIGVDISSIHELKLNKFENSDIIIDAILGVGIKGEVKGEIKEVIELINKNKKMVVSVDIPSGLDADNGEIHGVCVKADLTISMGFLKKGFFIGKGPEYSGKIKVVDIGFPKFYYENK